MFENEKKTESSPHFPGLTCRESQRFALLVMVLLVMSLLLAMFFSRLPRLFLWIDFPSSLSPLSLPFDAAVKRRP